MAGIEYVDENIRLPLIWLVTAGSVIAAALVLFGKWKALFIPVVLLLAQAIVPALVSQFYVKPNELALQRPYIVKHIEATRAAYDLAEQLREVQYPAQLETKIDVAGNQSLIENVRLWDWRAFHDTVTQIQALRQYYVFHDTDVDRYVLDGELRQVMLTPRELDISQLADATANWINGHFIYTHGYGLVMAEAAKITPNGQPVLIIQDAPPKVNTKSLQLTRPEIYFGEVTHEPVFVRTQQPEFNYPAGSDIVQTRYEGKGGIPVASFGMRLMTAIAYGDRNILLTSLLTPESRMLIRRNIRERLQELAGFIRWDTDPYLVVNGEGRMVWMVDGLTTSRHHPYSRLIRHQDLGVLNYVRNSVKATVDAYDGTVRMYVFDEGDPVLRAWRTIFPSLFLPESSMPADLRAHARYSEPMFRTQSEIYRTYHMTDPESFYNREDVWDIARNVHGPGGKPDTATPTFIVATLPGETEPEYLLLLPFTPRNKDNLIGLMAARCDGEKLGEIVVLQLSKQSLIYGPLQIEARIDSDQVIAKDLSLWNQQGSQVLRGQMLVLPVDESFIYVEPIYIQSAQARMPQLKKVVVAVGNNLIYRDTYEQAIAELAGTALPPETSLKAADTPPQTAGAAPPAPPAGDPRIESIRNHLRRYRELVSQGKWSEAGRELEALENEVNRR